MQSSAAGDAAAMQAEAAREAARIQADASNRATDLQGRMWDDQKQLYSQQREDLEPWRKTGVGALSELGNADFRRDFTVADFQKDPGYEFRMAEGMKALERSAAARGGLNSGGTLKALSRYGQDYASGEYQNAYNRFNSDRDRRFNRLSSLAGIGQTANSQVGNASANLGAAGQGYANSAGGLMMGAANSAAGGITGAANANAAGRIGSANAWGGALSGTGRNWMDMAMMSQLG
jgi:hypothetical protein